MNDTYVNYEYITQSDDVWEQAPADAVMLAISFLNMRNEEATQRAFQVLNVWADLGKLFAVLPIDAVQQLYEMKYGLEEGRAQFVQDRAKYHGEKQEELKTYRVGISATTGGYIPVQATSEDVIDAVVEKLVEDADQDLYAIEGFEQTHFECQATEIQEEE